jgi:hypothetical protein
MPRYGHFTPGKTQYTLCLRVGGPQGRSGWVRKISPPTGIRSPDRPAPNESLYRTTRTVFIHPNIVSALLLRYNIRTSNNKTLFMTTLKRLTEVTQCKQSDKNSRNLRNHWNHSNAGNLCNQQHSKVNSVVTNVNRPSRAVPFFFFFDFNQNWKRRKFSLNIPV